MHLSEHQLAYAAAIKTLLPHWSEEQCVNAMLVHFTCGKERAAAYEKLGTKKYAEFEPSVRNQIHLWDRFAVYDLSGNYLATTFSQTTSREAIEYAKKWHPSCRDHERLTARRLGLLETDPYYLPQKNPTVAQKCYAVLAGAANG